MRTKYLLLLAFYFLFFAAAALPSAAVSAQQSTPSDDDVNAIASQLYCPVCENIPLDVCPTTACHQWRELIRKMLAEGKTEAEIKQYFMDYYGASVLSEPPYAGINWLVYIVPPVAFFIGAGLLFLAFRTWKRMPHEPGPAAGELSDPAGDDQYVARLEEELRKRK